MRYVRRIFLGVVLLGATLYLGDYVAVRYSRNQFGVVKVERSYAVPLKDGKTEFMFDQPENRTCVHSLFPHFGDSPCWWVNRHKRERINM